uniref:CNNM transmembrane domain-containing protein n=1 Tax=Neobodo designis TaxID=312471 RepID=A0A7S1PL17_NEODS|mmetsp:Transcript_10536/g.32738  ORF Transcript_10536/g.32738 Transcript_10536/m.32738 type:complete len:189 (+) Transcript_10536:37-603(+)
MATRGIRLRIAWLLVIFAVIAALAVAADEAAATGEAPPGGEAESPPTEEPHKLNTQTQVLLAVVLIALSAVFAGLTLGIMAVDTLSLEIIASAGSEPDRTHAQTILPVRRKGHQTLCTLVLGNMWANVMIAQFCADVNPEGGGGEEEGGSGMQDFLWGVGETLSSFKEKADKRQKSLGTKIKGFLDDL